MDSNERLRFCVKQLVVAFPHTELSDEGVAVYVRLLSDIPIDDLEVVIHQAISECKFLPTIAELRDRWHTMTRTIDEKTSAEAWEDVIEQIQKVGWIGTPKFDSELTTAVVRSMGWRNLCASTEPAVERAQFMRMYDARLNRKNQMEKLLPQSREMVERHRKLGMKSVGNLLLGDNSDN